MAFRSTPPVLRPCLNASIARSRNAALACAFASLLGACSSNDVRHRPSAFQEEGGSGGASGSSSTTVEAGAVETGGAGGTSIIEVSPDATIVMPADDAASCAAASKAADPRPLDLFILLDKSGSMTKDGDRWDPVTKAIKDFIDSPDLAGIGVGLQYFPLSTTEVEKCAAATYQKPDVPIAALPGNAMALKDSIDAHHFTAAEALNPDHKWTPTHPATDGVTAYLADWAKMNPNHVVALLLATDGEPYGCDGNTVDTVALVLGAAAAAMPPVKTYVLGIGDVANLTTMAHAGGTGKEPFIVDVTSPNGPQNFLEALKAIRAFSLPCDYVIPTPPEGELDPMKVNVEYIAPGQAPAPMTQVADQAACVPMQSNWYYDNAEMPTKIVMCPAACSALGSAGGQVNIVFGCQTRVAR